MDEMLIPKLNESEHTLNDTSHHWRLHEGNFFFLSEETCSSTFQVALLMVNS